MSNWTYKVRCKFPTCLHLEIVMEHDPNVSSWFVWLLINFSSKINKNIDQAHYHHYRKRALCRVPEALGKALKTLGKGFAECDTRQRRLGKQCIGKAFFAEYFFSGTRQRGLPSAREHSAKKSGRYGDEVTETASLPSVKDDTRQRS